MKSAAFSFLFFYVSAAELYLGCLAILCFRVLVDAKWLEPLLPAVVKVQKFGWLLALFFPFLVMAVPFLYPWGAAPVEGNAFRRVYLSQGGFALRGLFYWALWLSLARGALRRRAYAGGPGLTLLFLSATFASVDWVLSLDKDFGSTAFGMVFFLSALLLAFGFAAFFGAARSTPNERQDQGGVHLAILCTWTYVSFMQFLVVWSGNLPAEAGWYLLREQGGWAVIPTLAGLGQFFIPFFLLLQSPVKRSLRANRTLALLSVSMQLLLVFWHVLPALRPELSLTLYDLVAFGLFAAAFVWLGRDSHAAV